MARATNLNEETMVARDKSKLPVILSEGWGSGRERRIATPPGDLHHDSCGDPSLPSEPPPLAQDDRGRSGGFETIPARRDVWPLQYSPQPFGNSTADAHPPSARARGCLPRLFLQRRRERLGEVRNRACAWAVKLLAPDATGGTSGARRTCVATLTPCTLGMTAVGKHIVEDFESLPDVEKRQVLSNLLRLSRGIELSDEERLAAADAVFLEYDRAEQDE